MPDENAPVRRTYYLKLDDKTLVTYEDRQGLNPGEALILMTNALLAKAVGIDAEEDD